MSRRSGFTLVEMLVTTAIIAVLSSLVVGGVVAAKRRARVSQVRANIDSIRVALAQYRADTRRYPRASPRSADPGELLRDDAPALYMALMNRPTPQLGGGPGSPYLPSWPHIARVRRAALAADAMGRTGDHGVTPLTDLERTRVFSVDYQTQYPPDGPTPLVLCDPWGNPYHYREWASVSTNWKESLAAQPVQRTGFGPSPWGGDPPLAGPIPDAPRDPYGFEIWSSGPNGVNEFGAPGSDDITSWRPH